MRRLLIFALLLTLLSGGSVTSCLAAINDAQARRCCATSCPDKPARNPSQCCAVIPAQDAEVAPSAHTADADALAHFSMSVAPGAAVLQSASTLVVASAAHSPPLLRLPLQILCSRQL
jgi:hypothetical protein